MSLTLFIVGFIVFLTHGLEAITGFGCTVLAVPFVTALIGVRAGIPLLAVIAWMLALYIVITKFRDINLRQFFIIVALTGLGMPLGIYMFNNVPVDYLKKLLAVFIVLVAVIQLKKIYRPAAEGKELPPLVYYIILVIGGVVHGIFASGGPFVVLYASKVLKDKGSFRATLCLLWASLNSILLVSYFKTGIFTRELMVNVGGMMPFLIAGIVAGELVHNKVDELVFRKMVFFVLLSTGLFMLVF